MARLYPGFEDVIEDVVDVSERDLFGFSFLWDFNREDFSIITGAPERSDQLNAWAQWLQHAATTQRGAARAYPADFGVDFVRVRDLLPEERAELIEAQIRETALTDPRTRRVFDFVVDTQGDRLFITFGAESVQDEELQITVSVPNG